MPVKSSFRLISNRVGQNRMRVLSLTEVRMLQYIDTLYINLKSGPLKWVLLQDMPMSKNSFKVLSIFLIFQDISINFKSLFFFFFLPVTIASNDPGKRFKGFLLQARKKDIGAREGTFSNLPANTKGLMCDHDNDAVTHDPAQSWNSLTFTWNVPNAAQGTVQFL